MSEDYICTEMGKDGCNFFVGKWTLCEDMWIHVHGEVYSIQHYVITFGSDLRQVGGLLRVLRFPPPIKLTATI